MQPESPLTTGNISLWHILQVSDVLDIEFGAALAQVVPGGPQAVLAWRPQQTFLPGRIPAGHEAETLAEDPSPLRIRQLPLLPGFAREPIATLAPTAPRVVERLLAQTPGHPASAALICTTPFFAPVAELWPGPVVYWLTDLIAAYPSANRKSVERLDRRLGRVASLLCPNSQRLADYLIETAGCDPRKVHIVPNATRAANLLPRTPTIPGPRPPAIAAIEQPERPIAGVLGNLAGNLDWLLLEQAVARTPWLSWVFVGPTSMPIADPHHRRAREAVMAAPHTHFVGRQPYGDLAAYARAFDVAVLPYLRCEPTYSGSSTRFYEHLAACRPMLATRGLEELNRTTPLPTLVDSASGMVDQLNALRAQGFDDGLTAARWRASLQGTWHTRAIAVRDALQQQLSGEHAPHAANQPAHASA